MHFVVVCAVLSFLCAYSCNFRILVIWIQSAILSLQTCSLYVCKGRECCDLWNGWGVDSRRSRYHQSWNWSGVCVYNTEEGRRWVSTAECSHWVLRCSTWPRRPHHIGLFSYTASGITSHRRPKWPELCIKTDSLPRGGGRNYSYATVHSLLFICILYHIRNLWCAHY